MYMHCPAFLDSSQLTSDHSYKSATYILLYYNTYLVILTVQSAVLLSGSRVGDPSFFMGMSAIPSDLANEIYLGCCVTTRLRYVKSSLNRHQKQTSTISH